MDILESYRILDIGPNASLEEVKRAYRELARVWHPDRFPNDVRLQQKAEEKLKQINIAYERICGRGTHEPRRPSTSTPRPTAQQARRSAPPPRSPPSPPQSPQSVSAKPKNTSWFWGPAGRPRSAWVLYLGFAIIALLFVLPYLRIPPVTQRPENVSPRQPDILDQLAQSPASSPPRASQTPNWAIVSPPPIEIRRAEPVNPTPIEIRRAEPVRELGSQSPYFTIGSTKNDVLRIQGTPDNFTESTFGYGYSTVRFENDRVVAWSNISPKLNAQLLPRAGTNARRFFTVGSSKDEVLSIQGTPDNFKESTIGYGYSTVRFENDRVVAWSNISPKLKALLRPSSP